MAQQKASEKEKKNTYAFSLSKKADDVITARSQAEMGGNRSKWLDKHLISLENEHA